MSNVLAVQLPRTRDAQLNLNAFVGACRGLLEILTPSEFDAISWDVTEAFRRPGSNHAINIHFCSWKTASSSKDPMMEPFVTFAKAYLIYERSRGGLSVAYSGQLTALRALHDTLAEDGVPCITKLSAPILNKTCTAIKQRASTSTGYSYGQYLEVLNEFVLKHGLASTAVPWRNWLPPPDASRSRVGKEFDERRQEKIPSADAFEALGSIFSIAVHPSDVLVTSVCALLCAAPSRISEVIRLPVNCRATQVAPDGSSLLQLRWWPVKGSPPMLKPVVSVMSEVVDEALDRLIDLTAEGRVLASWYTDHPDAIYLPPGLEQLRGRRSLSMREVDAIVYGADSYRSNRPNTWCKANKVQTWPEGRRVYASFDDVQAAVLRMLPRGFPIADDESGLLYRDALMVLRKGQLNPDKAACSCMFEPVEQADIGGRLGRRHTLSIFDKHAFVEGDGSRIWIATHQFRHYLNTLAQGAHLSQLDVARWSGRRNISQNAAYDHTSGKDLLEKVRSAITGDQADYSPLARLQKISPVAREEFVRLRVPTAHTTDFGYCIHDFTMLPCQIHQDCINCDESVCIKGDTDREQNIRSARDEAQTLLESARAALEKNDSGADRWIVHHQMTLDRLDNLCRILDDPSVPTGSIIQLAGIVPASRAVPLPPAKKLVGS